MSRLTALLLLALSSAPCAAAPVTPPTDAGADQALVELGRALFFDRNLSRNRSQSCASCHDPARAFSDGRENGVAAAASLGDDGRSIGTRNAPSIAYASQVPPFERDAEGHWRGGLFHDGRAADLVEQAGQPILNPAEMGMPDAAAVVARLRENPAHVRAFETRFGTGIFSDDQAAFAALRAALAAFERTPEFAAFDSRYDRWLRGEARLTDAEEEGRRLFFSTLTNCTACHLAGSTGTESRETFSNQRYFNIGVPANPALPGAAQGDPGLAGNARVADPAQAGRYRVPTLRNVAVTGPYMHNGVFRDLRTAIFFYNQHLVDNAANRINPETSAPWDPAEYPATLDATELRQGQPLGEERIDLLLAFLATLTDARFEALLKK